MNCSKIIFLLLIIISIHNCSNSPSNDDKIVPKQKSVMELIDDHNLEMIEDQYQIKVNSKEIEQYFENIEFDDMFKQWTIYFQYEINENYKNQTAELIKIEKENLHKFKTKAAKILEKTDSTELTVIGHLKIIQSLIDSLEIDIIKAEESLNRSR